MNQNTATDQDSERHLSGQRGQELFRREALEHHARGLRDEGSLLRISPSWTRWAYRLLLLVFAAAALFAVLGSVHEYAAGPAVVRLEGHSEVTAKLPGIVTAVEVEAGQRVAAGDLLVRFYGAQEAAELDRVRREFELGLIRRLRDPSDPAAESALSRLRAQQELAEARLEERSARAPHPGVVSDLRVRPGQHLVPGQVVLSLVGEDPAAPEAGERDLGLSIVALFPGHYRPLLRPGMKLRLELQGYRYAYQHLVIDRVDDEVVGPAEARRVLGAGIGDALSLSGPLVLVRARLPAATFESGGRVYEYHDGILGVAEVRVRSERILQTLLPGSRALFEGSGA